MEFFSKGQKPTSGFWQLCRPCQRGISYIPKSIFPSLRASGIRELRKPNDNDRQPTPTFAPKARKKTLPHRWLKPFSRNGKVECCAFFVLFLRILSFSTIFSSLFSSFCDLGLDAGRMEGYPKARSHCGLGYHCRFFGCSYMVIF